jgi:CheY-like chemotaxis protein
MPLQSGKVPGRTILIVDDEEQVRDALTTLLDREGYTVYSAAGPEAALESSAARRSSS